MVKNLVQKISNVMIVGGVLSILTFSGLAVNNTKKILSMNPDTRNYKAHVEYKHNLNIVYLIGVTLASAIPLSRLAIKEEYRI